MSYETSSATDVNDLLGKLRLFLIDDGWTIDFNGARVDTTGNALLVSKGGNCFGFMTQTIGGSAGDPASFFGAFQYPGPYNGSLAPHLQTNASAISIANNMPGPFQAYHFFSGENAAGVSYVHCVVEATPGSFRHFGVGQINKLGAITTGNYCYAGSWNYGSSYINSLNDRHSVPWAALENSQVNAWRGTIIRCDGDALSPRYGVFNSRSDVDGGLRQIRGGYNSDLSGLMLPPSTLTGRTPLLPIFGSVLRPSAFYSMLGGPADLRFVNLTNLLPGDTLSLGADSWKVFPIRRRNGSAGLESSEYWGYAYKVNV